MRLNNLSWMNCVEDNKNPVSTLLANYVIYTSQMKGFKIIAQQLGLGYSNEPF